MQRPWDTTTEIMPNKILPQRPCQKRTVPSVTVYFITSLNDLYIPEEMFKKLKGKKIEIVETREGILLKLVKDPITEARGSLKGSRFSVEKYMQYKEREKGGSRK